ncbi:hypothetical protein F3Y22_tig00110429pilonHSYRG00225 [Hibiscus syriacus]|uniref:RNase H type-1 domain-containing protein n=1 Tax=Hibiscus syriacus TaxID=106335 RepID=A0A6A3AMY5_HIBSY|nr:hypothetical protein F3Y22_tig00110429pilonHSYRG00225 [Hibiscus syriacus]
MKVLRDCREAIWDLLIPPQMASSFFSSDLQQWLSTNLNSNSTVTQWDLPWTSLFASMVWQLWKNRNDMVFSNTSQVCYVILSRSLTWACFYSESRLCSTNDHHHAPQPISWQALDSGWICMIVDGFVNSTTKQGTIGGVALGNLHWLTCLENGFEFLSIQTDSLEATKLLNQTDTAFSSLSLVRAIDKFQRQAWVAFINWIPRKGNMLVDALAKSADLSNRNTVIFESLSDKF